MFSIVVVATCRPVCDPLSSPQAIEIFEFLKTIRYDNWYTTRANWKTLKPVNYFPTEECVCVCVCVCVCDEVAAQTTC